ncbi:PAS domain S-box protein [Ostertagia ostertagi]
MAERLQESEQQYKSLTNSLPLMIYTTSSCNRITYANQWFYSYLGLSLDEINDAGWGALVHPDDFDVQWHTDDVATSMIIPEQRLRDFRTGEYRWHTGISIAITDDLGAIKYWNSFMVDIHARKLMEQALKDNDHLKKIQSELEEKVLLLNESNRQLEQFAYVTSHDLQEPLRKITFYSDFLSTRFKDRIPDEAQLFFNNLMSASERMKILVQDILAYSTVRSTSFETIDLNNIIEEVIQDCEIPIREKNAQITISELPEIEGNPRQMKQLFENFLSNGLKFHKHGEPPELSVSAEVTADFVTITFADHGIGFENQYLSKMFDLFQRLNPRDKYEGTGIGLAICKKIAELHHGNISAVGAAGVGATFIVKLPLKQSQ